MEEQIGLEEAERMFHDYAGLLNQEFTEKQDAKGATDECVQIASALLESSFVIIVRFQQSSEILHPSDDMIQTVLTFEYDLALVKHQIPIGEPLAIAAATTKIIGPPVAAVGTRTISKRDEDWLRSALGSIGTDNPDINT
ncbi:MAG: hypothetical protein Q8R30_02035 [bacterium]|nr:hypothetical protein [bacterium]MDZ4285564.1 hypothetical protein [Candidatus Sungbacteria bacterium]